jgi:hypothetical protein
MHHGGKMTTKTCSKCGEEKPATTEFFHRHRNGLRAACKVCIKQYQQANREAIAERRKQHYQANREALLEQQKQQRQAKRAEQPACIYQIVNNQNGRIYVGETIQGELRWKRHLTYLKGGYHINPNLQEDFNKFGEEVFEWSIIKELPKDRELLTKEEKLHIDSLIAEGKSLYNVHLVS